MFEPLLSHIFLNYITVSISLLHSFFLMISYFMVPPRCATLHSMYFYRTVCVIIVCFDINFLFSLLHFISFDHVLCNLMRRMLFNSHTLMLCVPTIYLSVARYYAHILFTFLYKLLYLHTPIICLTLANMFYHLKLFNVVQLMKWNFKFLTLIYPNG